MRSLTKFPDSDHRTICPPTGTAAVGARSDRAAAWLLLVAAELILYFVNNASRLVS